jgi:hypothetical protein
MQMQQMGNGLVSLTNIRNTLADILAIGGLRNADRYYAPMNRDIEAQLMQQRQMAMAQQQPPMDPLVMAEQIKAQQKAQSDMMKMQLDAQKELAKDDRERDKMDQNLVVEAAKILGQYGTKVDLERIKAAQQEQRYADQQPTQAAIGARY